MSEFVSKCMGCGHEWGRRPLSEREAENWPAERGGMVSHGYCCRACAAGMLTACGVDPLAPVGKEER